MSIVTGSDVGLLDNPPKKNIRGEFKVALVVGVPTYGMVDIEFMENMVHMTCPVNFSPHLYMPRGREVGAACNMIVDYALKVDARYIYFREDDVITPPGALERLMTLDVDIVAGLCMSKQKPPFPILFKAFGGGPAIDWYKEVGKPIKCAGIGMGAMLIKTEVFKKIPKPWFRSINLTTIISDRKIGRMTQDLFFCMKAIEAGYDIWCDTGTCCGHKDVYTGNVYFFDVEKQMPAWVEASTGKIRYGISAQRREKVEGVEDITPEVRKNVRELFIKEIVHEAFPNANWETIEKELKIEKEKKND